MVYTASASHPDSNNNLSHRWYNQRIRPILPTRTSPPDQANDSGKRFNPVTSCLISSDLPYSSISLISYINAIDARARYPPCTNLSRRHHTEMLKGGNINSGIQSRRRDKSLDLDKRVMRGMTIRMRREGSSISIVVDVLTIS